LADSLAPDVLEPLLTGRLGRPYLYRKRCEETQRALDNCETEGATAVCEEQTAGTWEAPVDTAILCSILLRPPRERRAAELPLVGAVATAEVVEAALGLSAQIKWPGDVMVDRKKVARILVESREGGAAVLGVALNVNQNRSELPEAPQVRAGSLLTIGGRRHERAALLANLLLRLEEAYTHWCHGGLDALYVGVGARDFLRGRRVSFNGESGIAVAIDRAGRLEIDVRGARQFIESGRVTYER
jgi:BirA family transcriptional regulator, biotin operon repressor / biotin---[acetyl-CoA-carboxylase] ligase